MSNVVRQKYSTEKSVVIYFWQSAWSYMHSEKLAPCDVTLTLLIPVQSWWQFPHSQMFVPFPQTSFLFCSLSKIWTVQQSRKLKQNPFFGVGLNSLFWFFMIQNSVA